MITAKDFRAIAGVLNREGYKIRKDDLVEELVRVFAGVNERFDENRFRRASGVEPALS